MRVLVCGGRHYTDREFVYRALDFAHAQTPITRIIHGGAWGADALAAAWARERGVECTRYMAEWQKFGLGAGHIRNQRMLTEGKPDAVIAFPGGTGTAGMCRQAKKAGLDIWEPYEGEPNNKPQEKNECRSENQAD